MRSTRLKSFWKLLLSTCSRIKVKNRFKRRRENSSPQSCLEVYASPTSNIIQTYVSLHTNRKCLESESWMKVSMSLRACCNREILNDGQTIYRRRHEQFDKSKKTNHINLTRVATTMIYLIRSTIWNNLTRTRRHNNCCARKTINKIKMIKTKRKKLTWSRNSSGSYKVNY